MYPNCNSTATQAFELMLNKKTNVNHKDHLGNTLLHYALEIKEAWIDVNLKYKIIKLLLEKKAQLNIDNKRGKKVIDLVKKQDKTIQKLFEDSTQ